MTATKGIAALLMAAIVSMAVPGPALANKPLVGVACGGGFYVRAPTKKIYWIHGDPLEKTVVHDGPAKLAALAECGAGTVAVFQDRDNPAHSRIFYSEDCLNIGAAGHHPVGQGWTAGHRPCLGGNAARHAMPARMIRHRGNDKRRCKMAATD